jgi:hypothetical protein
MAVISACGGPARDQHQREGRDERQRSRAEPREGQPQRQREDRELRPAQRRKRASQNMLCLVHDNLRHLHHSLGARG